MISSFFRHILEYPAIKGWLERHPRLAGQIKKRLSTQDFTGLPMTILGGLFFYVLALLLGIVQSILVYDPLIAVDIRIENLLYFLRSDPALHFFYVTTLLAESGVIIAAAVALTALLWFQRKRIWVLTLWLTLIPAEAVTYVGKLIFHRGRPDVIMQAVSEDSFSFPSGHATSAAAFYGLLTYLLLRNFKSWKARFVTAVTAAALIVMVDLSRLYLGVHYLSDVLAGNLVGFAALLLAIGATEWLIAENKVTRPERFRLRHAAGIVALELVIVFFLVKIAPLPSAGKAEPHSKATPVQEVLPLFEKGLLPRYTETPTGNKMEPISLIILTPEQCFVDAFSRAHWLLADGISLQSAKSMSKAAILNREYPTAPITPSFYNALPNDFGLEKETDRKSVRSRHHARFWKTEYVTSQGTLFVGTISLDTGLKWGIVHTIAPDIDTERDLLAADLKSSGNVLKDELIPFTKPELGANFLGDPFFTDGKAVFMTLRSCH